MGCLTFACRVDYRLGEARMEVSDERKPVGDGNKR